MSGSTVIVEDILIADDHPMVADAVAALVAARFPGARVRMAADFASATAAVAAAVPQLVLIDGDMPGAGPRAGIGAILAAVPAARVIVLSGIRDDALVDHLLMAGAAGFLPKSASPAVMLAAIDLVLAGGRYRPEQLGPDRVSPVPVLAGRLAEVARLLGDGLTNKAIARTLGISPETVKTHVALLLAVLGAANRAEAAVKARSVGTESR